VRAKKEKGFISRCWQKKIIVTKKITEILKEISPRDPVERCMGILPVDPIYKASLDGVNKDFMFFLAELLPGYIFETVCQETFRKDLVQEGT
jgi:hypothetical protein